jgi:hypothetical protein
MKRALSIYQYVAPIILAPMSFLLWRREYSGNLKLTAAAWLVPILWAYIVPGIGTNVLMVWELDTRIRLGRFRPHHGFVFGSATAMLAWLVHAAPARTPWGIARNALVLCSVIGFWNVLYEVKALQSGILRVYNQPWADGRGEAAIVMDYAPWFFGGFGAVYGAGVGLMELIDSRGALSTSIFAGVFSLMLVVALIVPATGYVLQSIRRHGHWGTRPVRKQCQSA